MKEPDSVDFYDVGLGGDMTAADEAEEWLLKLTKKDRKSNLKALHL